MLLLLSTAARHFEYLRTATVGLMPRRCLPKEGEAHALFLQIVAGMKELVHSIWEANSIERSTAGLCAAFEGLTEDDAQDIASTITEFCLLHEDKDEATDELMRLTVAFLLNSFASASHNEVWLCRFCALFNHSCDPSAVLDTDERTVAMRLLRSVSAGEEITFCYVPLKEDPAAWPLQRRQDFLSKSFGFTCSCHRCMEEAAEAGVDNFQVPRSIGRHWDPRVTMRWESATGQLVLLVSVDLAEVLPLVAGELRCDLAAEQLRLTAGERQASVHLPCRCVEVAAKLTRRRLLLTLAEDVDKKRSKSW
eukprot:Skav207262  [mRNA]  locus=scaffold2560:221385:222308:- [translate_table: standard]